MSDLKSKQTSLNSLSIEQQEALLEFARVSSYVAENACATALQWVPQMLAYLPDSETYTANEAARAMGHICEFLKQLTEERVLLQKAGVGLSR